MKAMWTGQLQAVLVWRFDRFARSVTHLLTALEQFRALNVHFISLQEQFDTSTPIGHVMFTIIGAMAQLERDMIRERVMAGLAQARAKGVRLGRPTVRIDPAALALLQDQGLPLPEIARRLRCSRSTVKRRLREAGHEAR
jgi:DNA invertase Pin-like site-specific DNA recombinase